jgi:D-sedoheptulose 7-phosphate isomerase
MTGDASNEAPDAFFDSEFEEHATVFVAARQALREPFGRMVSACVKAVRDGGKILFFGNGGSASDAQHLATELVVRFRKDRPAIAAIALTTDTSALTAIGNDLGFEELFARQVEALGRRGDVAIGISTSGRSPNVLKGLAAGRANGLVTIGLGGGNGGSLHEVSDVTLIVPSATTARIQETHIMLGHMLCAAIERELGYAA